MGLISRVSSRTYRRKLEKNDAPIHHHPTWLATSHLRWLQTPRRRWLCPKHPIQRFFLVRFLQKIPKCLDQLFYWFVYGSLYLVLAHFTVYQLSIFLCDECW